MSPHRPPPPSADARPAPQGDLVVFQGIEKSFFGVPVLRQVSFPVRAGRILGLVGENGAGKSTLMNVLGGNCAPDGGQILFGGEPYAPRHPTEARAAGIAFVHQELNLFPNLSIGENLFLHDFPRRAGVPWIDRREVRNRTRALLQQVGLERAPDTPVEQLPPGEQQLVEIARALGAHARLLILDEPTTSLSARECARLFELLSQLRAQGLTLIYISHALEDVLRLCDDLLVLRDGAVVGQGPRTAFPVERLVTLMVGRELERLYPARQVPAADGSHPAQAAEVARSTPRLAVRGLTQPGIIRDIHFEVRAGEILGVAGLMGAGRTELARILFGLEPAARGRIELDGHVLTGGPRARIQRGLAFLTEDRRAEGLCLDASIADNLGLVTLPAHAQNPGRWINRTRLRAALETMRAAVRLSSGRDDQPVRTLSGGNQQKVVLGKWLLAKPKVLLLDEPTRGIDVGARYEIYQLIQQLADAGAGVLLISSEIEELLGLCERLLVMRQGSIAAEFRRAEFDREKILAAALPATAIATPAPDPA